MTFRLKPPEPTESDITRSIRSYLNMRGIWHYKQWQGLGSLRGVADIIGIFRGRYLAIEVKRPGYGPTENQQTFLDKVKREGGIAFVAHSVQEVMDTLGG